MPQMGKTEQDWNGLKFGFLKTVQPNSFSNFAPASCKFKNNAQERYSFVCLTALILCITQQISIQGGSAPTSKPVQIQFLHKNGTPFHIPCLELCTPFTCCKCTVLSIGIHDKNRTLSQLYKTMKFIGSTYDTFPYAFTNFTSQIRNLSYTWSLKKLPFWSGASPSKSL